MCKEQALKIDQHVHGALCCCGEGGLGNVGGLLLSGFLSDEFILQQQQKKRVLHFQKEMEINISQSYLSSSTLSVSTSLSSVHLTLESNCLVMCPESWNLLELWKVLLLPEADVPISRTLLSTRSMKVTLPSF